MRAHDTNHGDLIDISRDHGNTRIIVKEQKKTRSREHRSQPPRAREVGGKITCNDAYDPVFPFYRANLLLLSFLLWCQEHPSLFDFGIDEWEADWDRSSASSEQRFRGRGAY
jgi:hypothetical protein